MLFRSAAEACLSGAAVLATPGVPLAVAMAGDGGAHIAAGNAADLAHAIDDVIDDSDRRMALVANGRLFLESLSPRGVSETYRRALSAESVMPEGARVR